MNTRATITNRRQYLRWISSLAACTFVSSGLRAGCSTPRIRAVAFDALAIFDPRPVFRLTEEWFPTRGEELSAAWRTRQFEYTWLRNAMHIYEDFWRVTSDALTYAANKCNLEVSPAQHARLMSAYLRLEPWPDVRVVLQELHQRGIRLALLSNFTMTMMRSCLRASGLASHFESLISTDQVKTYKPDPAAYLLAAQAFHLRKEEIAFAAFGGWDAAGAKSFGYPTYWANRTHAPVEELGARPDDVYQDLTHLPEFLLHRA